MSTPARQIAIPRLPNFKRVSPNALAYIHWAKRYSAVKREIDEWRIALIAQCGLAPVPHGTEPVVEGDAALRITLRFPKKRRVDGDNALASLKPLIDLTQVPRAVLRGGKPRMLPGHLGWVADDKQYGDRITLTMEEETGEQATVLALDEAAAASHLT